MDTAVKAAGWVVGKALAPVTGGLLEAWAASKGLGPNVDALKVELLYAQAMLENAQCREIHSPALKELLYKLRQLAYGADDVLDELEYFRIQDELDGTYHAAEAHAGGCVQDLILNARHVAGAVAAKLKPSRGSPHTIRGEPDEQEDSAKHGCLSSACSCGGGTVSSSSPPSGNVACLGNGGHGLFCGALPSEIKGCLCGKPSDEMRSPPASTHNNQFQKKDGCGCLLKVTPTACDTVKESVGKCLPCFSSQFVDDGNAHTSKSENPNMLGKQKGFLRGAWTSSKAQQTKDTEQAPKLKFNRVETSAKMEEVTEHLKYVCAKVSNVLSLEFMGTNRITRKYLAITRPITTSDITENDFYGRDTQKKLIVDGIIQGKYSANGELVVLPIVGPGGIGKTTFTQHVYAELKNHFDPVKKKNHFDVTIWICVSLNFTASRLAQEAVKQIPSVADEKENSTDQERIDHRLKAKRFLLVLDDMWECLEDEWKRLLAPFQRAGGKGSIVIVTTRIREVAQIVKTVDLPIEMERLEEKDFLKFFEACIFSGQRPWEGHTELYDVGVKIVSKLKGFPLAEKTVGRLLRNQLTWEHWNKVLESKEWEHQKTKNDIMPALKLSYDYLPFHLQQCFYYCALFPEDYEFERKELVYLWIGLDIVHPCDPGQTIEQTGQGYLHDLVNHGFFKENKRNDGSPYYVVHDLLHDLAVNISSFECLSICSSSVKSVHIRQDMRHLSIIIDNKDVEDIKTFKYYKDDLSALDKRLNVENLRTLMVFGGHHESFARNFCDLFEKARALRVVYLSGASPYAMEVMKHRFPEHIHLRYLRIRSSDDTKVVDFNLSVLTRLYHLEVIDVQKCKGCYGFTRHMSNLAKLRHFLVPQNGLQLHSDIVEVGKLKLLQELRSFEVGKEIKGFELSQLGQLSELGGSLVICNLEKIRETEEVHEARLIQMKYLDGLTLQWNANRPEIDARNEENTLEILIPHNNLKDLCIRGHGGTKCPEWLGENLCVKNLESLHLDGVAWNIFPPIGELSLVDGTHEEISSNTHHKRFQNLRRLELVNLPRLKNWVVQAPCHLFAQLKALVIMDCSELINVSFSHSTCCQREKEKEANMNWFHSSLQELKIESCPKLISFPPVPWTSTSCSAKIEGVGSGLNLVCQEYKHSGYSLDIKGATALDDGTFWNVLAFDNLTELKELAMGACPPLPLHHFQMLSSLKTLRLESGSNIVLPLVEGESHVKYEFHSVECITINWPDASAKELTQLLTYFPNLSKLDVLFCTKITGLAVVEKQATETPVLASSDNEVDEDIEIEKHQQQQDGTRGDEEIAASSAEGLLLLPSQLEVLFIWKCPELCLCSNPIDHNRESGQIRGGRGLQGLRSLRSLEVGDCPRFLSSYSTPSSSSCFPFPTSLECLSLEGAVGTATLLPLSNFTSLTELFIWRCGDLLRGEGLLPLLAQGRLTQLTLCRTLNFFAGFKPSLPDEQEFPSSSSKLQELQTDDVAGVLAAPICTLLSSSLTRLDLCGANEVERFTEEQEEALHLLTSLKEINFGWCDKLQGLPAGLHRLPNLKRLDIYDCAAMRSLHGLPSSLQILNIISCPAIRSLPKVNDLPSSLQKLDVSRSNSQELRRQCRKLIGIIPIVDA